MIKESSDYHRFFIFSNAKTGTLDDFKLNKIKEFENLGYNLSKEEWYPYPLNKKILQEEGYRVPDDVQIIGFDGITKFGNEGDELFVSSICQPVKHIAEKCVEILTSQTDSIAPSVTLLPVDYRCGGTTKDAV